MTVLEDPPAPTAPAKGGNEGGGGLVFIAMAGVLIALVATVVIIGLIGLLRDEDDGGGSGGDGAAEATTLGITLSEFKIEGDLEAAPGDVSLAGRPTTAASSTISCCRDRRRDADAERRRQRHPRPGLARRGHLPAVSAACAGHAESGMDATLEITTTPAPTGEAAAGGTHDHNSPDFDADEMDAIMVNSMLEFPAETEGKGNQILEPEILPDGTKKFVLEASIIDWEVAPGQIVEAWAYNGQVPGPQIIVDVGDNVQVELRPTTRRWAPTSTGTASTPRTIRTACRRSRRTRSRPARRFTYEFVARRAGDRHVPRPPALADLGGQRHVRCVPHR